MKPSRLGRAPQDLGFEAHVVAFAAALLRCSHLMASLEVISIHSSSLPLSSAHQESHTTGLASRPSPFVELRVRRDDSCLGLGWSAEMTKLALGRRTVNPLRILGNS